MWLLLIVALWSAAIEAAAYVVGQKLKLAGQESMEEHAQWIIRAICLDPAVMNFVGFALFLLLAFRLNDSHQRYVNASSIWKEGIIGPLHAISDRIFGGYREGPWHAKDLLRIAAHLCGFVISLVSDLQQNGSEESLRYFLGETDANRVISAVNGPDYCLDVVRGYVHESFRQTTLLNKFMSRQNSKCVMAMMKQL